MRLINEHWAPKDTLAILEDKVNCADNLISIALVATQIENLLLENFVNNLK